MVVYSRMDLLWGLYFQTSSVKTTKEIQPTTIRSLKGLNNRFRIAQQTAIEANMSMAQIISLNMSMITTKTILPIMSTISALAAQHIQINQE